MIALLEKRRRDENEGLATEGMVAVRHNLLESLLMLGKFRASKAPLRPPAKNLVTNSRTASMTNTVSRSIANVLNSALTESL